MSKKINIGVLGCANIAERFVLPSIIELSENYNLVGIASRTEKKAILFAEKFNTKAYFSYDNVLDLEALEAVYIPLPNALHYEWIKKSLQKGLHVLVEKSLACTYNEVLELNNLAKEKDLVLIENFQFRFHSQLKYIKDLVENGTIGELRNIRSSFGFPPFSDEDNIRYTKELGGGALLDAGAYTIKISQIFMGDEIEVVTSSLVYDIEKDVDIYGSATLKRDSDKLTSQVSFGFDNFYQCNIELWGSKGKIYTNRIFTSPPGYQPTIEIEINEGKEIITLKSDHHFKNMLLYFYKLINTQKGLENEYSQNINQARLINEVKLRK